MNKYIVCDRCDFKQPAPRWADSFRGKELVYEFNNNALAPVKTGFGWCNSCAKATLVENIPTHDEIDLVISHITRNLLSLDHGIVPPSFAEASVFGVSWSSLWRGRGALIRHPDLAGFLTEYRSYLPKVLDAEAQWRRLASIRTNPRCLMCGSDETESINEEHLAAPAGQLGLRHANCTGMLFVISEPERIMAQPLRTPTVSDFEVERFTPNGNTMRTLSELLDRYDREVIDLIEKVVRLEVREKNWNNERWKSIYPETNSTEFIMADVIGSFVHDELEERDISWFRTGFGFLYQPIAQYVRREIVTNT